MRMILVRCRHAVFLSILGSFPLLACGKSTEPPSPPVDKPSEPALCESHEECDDGRFCNGSEKCDPQDNAADNKGCVASDAPCGDGRCSEKAEECLVPCDVNPDADKDGSEDAACGGDDCDDGDPERYPGNLEVCDADDVDEDCDEKTFGDRDSDDDGYVDMQCCNGTGKNRACGNDCNDAEEGVHPSEAENCDGVDNDCDGEVDEGFECKRGDAPLECMTASGLVGGRACTSVCERSVCRAQEVCNGLDDDADGDVDNGFACIKNAIGTPCETACGTQGVGTCNEECSGVVACVAPDDLCNYCDDNLASGINEEKPLATAVQQFKMPHGASFTGSASALEPIESSSPQGMVMDFYSQLLSGSAYNEKGGIWFALGSRVGWGPIEFEVSIQVLGPEEVNGPAYGGWGVELLSGEPREGIGSFGGMARGGLGVEWSWGHPADSTHSATSSDTFRVHGVMNPAYYQPLPGGVPQETHQSWTTQRLHIRYTPEDPTTAEKDEELLVKNGKNGAIITRVPDPNFPSGPSLSNVLPIGSSFGIAVTAASNGMPFQAKVYVQEIVINTNTGASAETAYNTGSVSGLCP